MARGSFGLWIIELRGDCEEVASEWYWLMILFLFFSILIYSNHQNFISIFLDDENMLALDIL